MKTTFPPVATRRAAARRSMSWAMTGSARAGRKPPFSAVKRPPAQVRHTKPMRRGKRGGRAAAAGGCRTGGGVGLPGAQAVGVDHLDAPAQQATTAIRRRSVLGSGFNRGGLNLVSPIQRQRWFQAVSGGPRAFPGVSGSAVDDHGSCAIVCEASRARQCARERRGLWAGSSGPEAAGAERVDWARAGAVSPPRAPRPEAHRESLRAFSTTTQPL